ncbi:hypothetical protein PBI_PEREGRIN_72 [Rhodococcus phage Peregrin]|nr:hypothetical protein PBI_PEREGRIN_72 [Rhodococcus phage Peregrin]
MPLSDVDLLPNDVNPGSPNHTNHHDVIHAALKELKTLSQTADTDGVKLTGFQTISGTKTFSVNPLVPNPTSTTHATNKQWTDSLANTYEPNIPLGTTSQYWRGDKTWVALTKSAAGLANVDNTSDVNKPISTLQAAALAAKEPTIATGTTAQYYRGDKTWATLNKAAVGLSNVDNTSDAAKPISTATQNALNLKAPKSDAVTLASAQNIGGTKTFTVSPKMGGTSTVGHVWTASSSDGSGSWQLLGVPATSMDWANVINKPATFPPDIGPSGTQAAAGNHTHTKASIGLGNVDNTSDANKPISTLTQAELDTKLTSARAINTSGGLTGGGDLTTNRTISIASGGVGLTQLATEVKREGFPFAQTMGKRAVGYGEFIDGISMPYAFTITSVKYRMGTADASGTTTCELRKNGVTVSGSSGTASVSPTAVTGTWAFAAGDILTVYTSAIGTTPGERLVADIIGTK